MTEDDCNSRGGAQTKCTTDSRHDAEEDTLSTAATAFGSDFEATTKDMPLQSSSIQPIYSHPPTNEFSVPYLRVAMENAKMEASLCSLNNATEEH